MPARFRPSLFVVFALRPLFGAAEPSNAPRPAKVSLLDTVKGVFERVAQRFEGIGEICGITVTENGHTRENP